MGRRQFSILRESIKSLSEHQGTRLELDEKSQFCELDVQLIKSVVRQSAQTLKHLQLCDDNITSSIISVLTLALTPAVKRRACHCPGELNHVLESLNLNRNKIDPNGGDPLGEILRFNPLSCLKLAKNNLRSAGTIEIFNALTWNPGYLMHIDLTSNQICHIAAKRMSQVLIMQKVVLKSLNLAFNEIGDRGVFWICLALSKNKGLTDLNLAHNGLTDVCVDSLISAMQANRTLTSLNLSYNDFTDSGLQSLIDSLEKHNCTLLSITIKSQSASSALLKKASLLCKRNKKNLKMLALAISIGRKLSLLSELIPPEISSMILKKCTNPLLLPAEHHSFTTLILSRSIFRLHFNEDPFTATHLIEHFVETK